MKQARTEIRHRALYRLIAALGESRKEVEIAQRIGQLSSAEATELDAMLDAIKGKILDTAAGYIVEARKDGTITHE